MYFHYRADRKVGRAILAIASRCLRGRTLLLELSTRIIKLVGMHRIALWIVPCRSTVILLHHIPKLNTSTDGWRISFHSDATLLVGE